MKPSQLFVVTLLLIVGCNDGPVSKKKRLTPAGEAAVQSVPTEKTEMHTKSLVLDDESTVRYSVQVPKGYVDSSPAPLIMALHFGGRVRPYYGASMVDILINPGLSELNAIVVAPDSIDGQWTSRKNEKAIKAVLEQVKKDYSIDEAKTLLTGFSMGGHGTWDFGGKHQELFKAAIPIAGNCHLESADWIIPLYVINSKADEVVPIEPTRKYVERVKELGGDVTFVELDDLTHFETMSFAKPLKAAVPWVKKVWGVEE